MKKTISQLLFCGLLITNSFSQTSFSPGFIITNNNEVVDGFIKTGNKKENFSKCHFQKEINSDAIDYNPEDIIGYRIKDGEYFVSMKIDSSSSNKVFLQYAFDGIIDLYYYYDNEGDHYFISKAGSPLIELRNDIKRLLQANQDAIGSSYWAEISPTMYESESKKYIGILKTLFQDAPKTSLKVNNTSFYLNSLVKISEDYHNEVCPGENCVNYSIKPLKLEIGIGLIFGYSLSNISFTKNSLIFLFDEYPQSNGYSIGTILELSDPFISNKISILFEAALCKNKYAIESSSIDLTTLKIPVMVKVKLPTKKMQPYFVAGLASNNFIQFKSNSDKYATFKLMDNKSQFGITTGIGTNINTIGKQKLIIHFRYEYLVGQHHLVFWDDKIGTNNSTMINLNFILGYIF